MKPPFSNSFGVVGAHGCLSPLESFLMYLCLLFCFVRLAGTSEEEMVTSRK